MPKSLDEEDESLLARLNALKPSSFGASPKTTNDKGEGNEHVGTKDLASRFAALGRGQKNVSLVNDEVAAHPEIITSEEDFEFQNLGLEDTNIEDLLADLELEDIKHAVSAKDWKGNVEESAKARDLLKEAHRYLKKPDSAKYDDAEGKNELHAGEEGQINPNQKRKGMDDFDEDAKPISEVENMVTGEPDDGLSEEVGERDIASAARQGQVDEPPEQANTGEVQSIIQIAIDEANLRKDAEACEDGAAADLADDADEQKDSNSNTASSEENALSLPSAPTALQELAEESPEDPTSLLPSAPTFRPSEKRQSPPEIPSDEDVDSWCIICLENASIQCIDCDGSLYCDRCWTEFHKGESAGYEERRHKALAYEKGGKTRKLKQPKRRVKIGAG